MTINDQRKLGEAKNALLSYFERKLYVPKIYFDAMWDGKHVDVLAIDRDGVGDVHTVLAFPRAYSADGRVDLDSQTKVVEELISEFRNIPANFKYIAAVETADREHWRAIFRINIDERLFSPDFIGRVGLLHIDAPENEEPRLELTLRPQRFRAKIAKLADEYVQSTAADWEIRA